MSSLFPGGGTYFSIQLDGLGDVHESVRDPFDLHCRFFTNMPHLNRAVNSLMMTFRSMGQEMLERKISILQILA